MQRSLFVPAEQGVAHETLSWILRGVPCLPCAFSASCLRYRQNAEGQKEVVWELTVVALRDPIPYPPTLGKIGDLCPVFVGIRTCTESTASAVGC